MQKFESCLFHFARYAEHYGSNGALPEYLYMYFFKYTTNHLQLLDKTLIHALIHKDVSCTTSNLANKWMPTSPKLAPSQVLPQCDLKLVRSIDPKQATVESKAVVSFYDASIQPEWQGWSWRCEWLDRTAKKLSP